MRLGEHWQVGGGVEWYRYDAEYDYASEVSFDPTLAAALDRPVRIVRDLHPEPNGEAYAAYVAAVVSLTSALTLDAGLRWDAQRYRAFSGEQVSPRLALQYGHDPATVLRLSWGRIAQAERPDELQVQDGEPLFHAVQRGTQTVLSIERRASASTTVRLEAFDKRVSNPKPLYENLLDPFALLPELEVDRVRVAPDRSRTYGVELSVRWNAPETWSAWGSYSFSEASDRIAGVQVPRSWDQKHAINAGVAWSRYPWQLAANATWHSGWRRNELQLVPGNPGPEIILAPRNSGYWPDYLSLDLRATWKRSLPVGSLEVFAEASNATNYTNPCCVSYSLVETDTGIGLNREQSSWLPRLLIVGARWWFP